MEWHQSRTDRENGIHRMDIVSNKSYNIQLIDDNGKITVSIDDYYNTLEIPKERFDAMIDRYNKATAGI